MVQALAQELISLAKKDEQLFKEVVLFLYFLRIIRMRRKIWYKHLHKN